MKKTIIFSLILLFSLNVISAQSITTDSLALVAFYEALDGPNWSNPSALGLAFNYQTVG